MQNQDEALVTKKKTDPEPEQLLATRNLTEVVQLWQNLAYGYGLLSRNIRLDTETFSLVPI